MEKSLPSLASILGSRSFQTIPELEKSLFIKIYTFAESLDIENKNLKEEIKRLRKHNFYMYSTHKHKEKLVLKITEENRMKDEKILKCLMKSPASKRMKRLLSKVGTVKTIPSSLNHQSQSNCNISLLGSNSKSKSRSKVIQSINTFSQRESPNPLNSKAMFSFKRAKTKLGFLDPLRAQNSSIKVPRVLKMKVANTKELVNWLFKQEEALSFKTESEGEIIQMSDVLKQNKQLVYLEELVKVEDNFIERFKTPRQGDLLKLREAIFTCIV